MDEEMTSLCKIETWELVKRHANRRVIGCKWIFKVKYGLSGSKRKIFKGMLVAKGHTQKEEVDFKKRFFLLLSGMHP